MSIRDSVAAPPPTRSFRIRRRLVASVGAGLTVCRERGPDLQPRVMWPESRPHGAGKDNSVVAHSATG